LSIFFGFDIFFMSSSLLPPLFFSCSSSRPLKHVSKSAFKTPLQYRWSMHVTKMNHWTYFHWIMEMNIWKKNLIKSPLWRARLMMIQILQSQISLLHIHMVYGAPVLWNMRSTCANCKSYGKSKTTKSKVVQNSCKIRANEAMSREFERLLHMNASSSYNISISACSLQLNKGLKCYLSNSARYPLWVTVSLCGCACFLLCKNQE